MYICSACKKSFLTVNQLRGHLGHCKLHNERQRQLYQKHFTEKFLRWWFEKKHETAHYLAELFNKKYTNFAHTTAGIIIGRAKNFGINTNGFSCYKNCKRLHKMYEGSNNVLAKGNKGYNIRQQHLSEEGITNVFQREEVKQKIKDTMFKKYGVYTSFELASFKFNSGAESIPHKTVLEFLKSKQLTPISELYNVDRKMFSKFNEELNKIYSPRPDIVLLNEKIIIEIYGNSWHADPLTYKDNDIIKKWGGSFTAKEIREFDAIRKRHLESFNFKVLEIWASDIYSR